MTDALGKEVVYSFGLHIAVLIVLLFEAVIVPRDPLEIHNAIRVDVVGLPEKMNDQPLLPKAEEKAPAPEPKKTKLPPKEAAHEATKPMAPTLPSPKAKKIDLEKSQRQALNQIKSMQALEKIKSQLKETKEKEQKGTLVKGNQVNEGNSLTGLEKIEYDRYFDELKGKILAQWNIPQWLADANLKAQVQVLIDERGYVIKKIFRRSSGNTVFDDSVIAAIDSSSPLPVPPKRLQGGLSTRGVVLNFPE